MILGMKVRKPDLQDMLKFHPKVLEFHFSDSDLNLELDSNFEQGLIVHCYEYFERTYHRVFGQQVYRGRTYTAIEFTTAAGLISMVELFLEGKIPKEGYVTQESVDWKDVLSTTFGKFYREDNDDYSIY